MTDLIRDPRQFITPGNCPLSCVFLPCCARYRVCSSFLSPLSPPFCVLYQVYSCFSFPLRRVFLLFEPLVLVFLSFFPLFHACSSISAEEKEFQTFAAESTGLRDVPGSGWIWQLSKDREVQGKGRGLGGHLCHPFSFQSCCQRGEGTTE